MKICGEVRRGPGRNLFWFWWRSGFFLESLIIFQDSVPLADTTWSDILQCISASYERISMNVFGAVRRGPMNILVAIRIRIRSDPGFPESKSGSKSRSFYCPARLTFLVLQRNTHRCALEVRVNFPESVKIWWAHWAVCYEINWNFNYSVVRRWLQIALLGGLLGWRAFKIYCHCFSFSSYSAIFCLFSCRRLL